MSDAPGGPGWWQASDQKWYPPEQAPGAAPAQAQPQYAMTGAAPQTESTATISLIIGILSLFCFGLLAGIPAIILGVMARKKIRSSNGALSGDGLALGGIITGAIGVAWSLAWIVFVVILGVFGESTTYYGY
jgi:hypothetical protein